MQGEIVITGLDLPSEMADDIDNVVSSWMYLWNPIDLGYLSGHEAHALVAGDIEGDVGDTFEAGELGSFEVTEADDGTEVLLGDPFRFDPENIDEWKDVY